MKYNECIKIVKYHNDQGVQEMPRNDKFLDKAEDMRYDKKNTVIV